MKPLLFFFALILSLDKFSSQNESSKWYFSNYAALDFMTNPPTALNNSAMQCNEGSTSMADEFGNLLFYSDGSTVWNKQHVIMANGTGLLGNQSASQSGIVVKKPGTNSIYYLFTLAATAGTAGLCYSEIDMSLAADLGSVTVKNTALHTPSCEKITGIKHCNGSDIWVITHDYNSGNFRAHLVTSAGVNPTAVTSFVGPIYNGGAWYGTMKISPTGKKICVAHANGPNNSTLELYDFDKSTGLVSNFLSLGAFPAITYDCEFSPDGSKLYGYYALLQWDLCAGSNAAILASKDTVVQTNSPIKNMQLAINGKIYVTIAGSQSMGVINYPNNPAATCNYINLSQSIAPNTGNQGLPNFITSSLKTPFSYTSGYSCNTVSFTSSYIPATSSCSAVDPISMIEWFFDDPVSGSQNTSTVTSPTHLYSSHGTYKVKLALHSGFCVADTIVQFVTLAPPPSINVSGNYTICQGGSTTLTASGATSYSWNGGSVTSSLVVNPAATTVYTVTGTHTNSSCASTKTISVIVNSCVSVKEYNDERTFKIYPNPFQQSISIESRSAAILRVYTQLGTMADELKINEGVFTLNTTEYSNGVYFLQLKTGDTYLHLKFIKTD